MKIIVCIKQIPEPTSIRLDPETGSIIRKDVSSIINPNDKNAIEAALTIREKHGGTVIALSMGPDQAEEALREALGMGVDAAVLLTDQQFAGADTWATSHTLGLAIRKMAPYDLIVCGIEALDGMTAQVGPQLAEFLDIPQLTYAINITLENNKVKIRQKLGDMDRMLEASLPALVTVARKINEPRIPPIDAILGAYEKDIPVWRANDFPGEENNFGLKASPTRLGKMFTLPTSRAQVEILEGNPTEAAGKLLEILKEKGVV